MCNSSELKTLFKVVFISFYKVMSWKLKDFLIIEDEELTISNEVFQNLENPQLNTIYLD